MSTFLELSALAGCLLFSGRLHTLYTERRYPPIGRQMMLSSRRINVWEQGSGKPLIYVHGNLGSIRDIKESPLLPFLSEYRVISFDRPGSGYSERKRSETLTLHDHAQVLDELITALDLQNPLVVGHSVGGSVALTHATRYPGSVDRYILLCPPAYPWPGGAENLSEVISRRPIVGPLFNEMLLVPLGSFLAQRGFRKTLGKHNEIPRAYFSMARAIALRPSQFLATAKDTGLLWETLRDLSPAYKSLQARITIISGNEDLTVPPHIHMEPLHQALPHSRLIRIDQAAHLPHFSHPAIVAEAISSSSIAF